MKPVYKKIENALFGKTADRATKVAVVIAAGYFSFIIIKMILK